MERHIFKDDECLCLCLPESPDSILEQTDYYDLLHLLDVRWKGLCVIGCECWRSHD